MGVLVSSMTRVQAGGMGIEVEMDPTPVMLVASWNKLGLDIRSFRVPLERAIREVVAPSLKTNFDVGGRPQWAYLSPAYAAKREAKKKGSTRGVIGRGGKVTAAIGPGSIAGLRNILVDTGKLRRAAGQLRLWQVDGIEGVAQMRLPADVWYGIVHQEGAGDVPQREWALFQQEDIDKIEEVFDNWMAERVEQARLGLPASRI